MADYRDVNYCFTVLIFLILLPIVALSKDDSNVGKDNLAISTKELCSELLVLLHKEANILTTVQKSIQKVLDINHISHEEREYKLKVLKIFKMELEASEKTLQVVINDFKRTLHSDFQSLQDIEESCHHRLKDMRNLTLEVEKDFHLIKELQKEIEMHHVNTSNPAGNQGSLMDDVLLTLSHAADELERELKDDTFKSALKGSGVKVETVIQLNEDLSNYYHLHDDGGSEEPLVLVDPRSNLYTLSRPQDTTVPHQDHNLLHDILLVVIFCFMFGIVFSFLKAPPIFGYMLVGVVLGPSGGNIMKSVVQIETLGEFGVFFIMFMIGVDFSPDKVKKVWKTSVEGGNILLLVSLIVGTVVGVLLGLDVTQSIFLAACLTFSSTPIILQFIHSEGNSRATSPEIPFLIKASVPMAEYPSNLMGLLVMQDIQLGAMMALLPLFGDFSHSSSHPYLVRLLIVLQTVIGVVLMLILAKLCSNPLMERVFRVVKGFLTSSDGSVLAAVTACFSMLLLADFLGVALELGCFLAGITLGFKGHTVVEKVSLLVEPLKDFFSCFFFVSLGFHIFPTFLKSELHTIAIFTFVTMFLKFVLSYTVIGCFTEHKDINTFMISVGLSQISEFTFVLGSRGRRLRIISREVYLLMLSSTIVSLLLTPFVWKMAVSIVFKQGTFTRTFTHS